MPPPEVTLKEKQRGSRFSYPGFRSVELATLDVFYRLARLRRIVAELS